jgi:GPI-anchor transamidase subunit GAA1
MMPYWDDYFIQYLAGLKQSRTLIASLSSFPQLLGHLLCYEYFSLRGPYPPHSTALEYGIDSLTLEIALPYSAPRVNASSVTRWKNKIKPTGDDLISIRQSKSIGDSISRIEIALRALSNLHERLHHSTSLYLPPKYGSFVKHEEFLVPNILVLLPMAIRALSIVLLDRKSPLAIYDILYAAIYVGTGTLLVSVLLTVIDHRFQLLDLPQSRIQDEPLWCSHVAVISVYLGVSVMWFRYRKQQTHVSLQSVQWFACLFALYVLIPIAFANVSLSFWPAVLWTPLLSFWRTTDPPETKSSFPLFWKRFNFSLSLLVLFATRPMQVVVPRLLPSYTPFVRYAYIPLHLLLVILYSNKYR